MRKLNKAQKAAAEAAEEALEHGSKTLDDVIDFVVPRARQARDQAESFLEPAYRDAKGRLVPLARDVRERVQPAVQDAYDTVSDRFMHDVYPRLSDAWEHAQENPKVAEASRRSRSTLAALRGDLVLPDRELPKPVRRGHVVRKIFAGLGIAALIGALVVAIRTVLGSSDDGWSPAEPLRPVDEDDADWGDNPFAADDVDVEPDVPNTAPTSLAEAEDAMVAEGGPAVDGSVEDAITPTYGEGAYVGTEPPEGYTIKGNERSMKYHTVEAAGYDRTNADVWFNSEEAAQSAGFTRALR